MFGSAFDREIFRDDAYRALISANCRIGSIENSLKFDWLRAKGPVADFSVGAQTFEEHTIELPVATAPGRAPLTVTAVHGTFNAAHYWLYPPAQP